MRRIAILLLLSCLGSVASAATEKAPPDWSIDMMVAKGIASTEERETFVASFVASCLAQNAASRMSRDELTDYCRCTAGKSTALITSSEISYMVANDRALPTSATEKLKAAARECGGYIIERQAGQ